MDKRSLPWTAKIPAGSSARRNVQFAGFVPGTQSNFSSRGIISLTSPCSPQENVPFAFRHVIVFRVSFGAGGQCIAIKTRGARKPFCDSSPSGYAFLLTMGTKIHRAKIARETLSANAADRTVNLRQKHTARPALLAGAKR
jgi:hypothetical protein